MAVTRLGTPEETILREMHPTSVKAAVGFMCLPGWYSTGWLLLSKSGALKGWVRQCYISTHRRVVVYGCEKGAEDELALRVGHDIGGAMQVGATARVVTGGEGWRKYSVHDITCLCNCLVSMIEVFILALSGTLLYEVQTLVTGLTRTVEHTGCTVDCFLEWVNASIGHGVGLARPWSPRRTTEHQKQTRPDTSKVVKAKARVAASSCSVTAPRHGNGEDIGRLHLRSEIEQQQDSTFGVLPDYHFRDKCMKFRIASMLCRLGMALTTTSDKKAALQDLEHAHYK
ncbi:hypothetical protein JB92DRAFT_2825805 [Gautieria morchelliformis]|nr:hypothetical protein JB92DRAFT_2825805 [Gautieria morchelliformis]